MSKRKKNLDEDSEGADSEEKGPETASHLSGTPSVVGASWAFQPAARGGRFPDVPTPGLSSSAGGCGHAWNGLSSSSSSRSKPAGQIPPRAPCVQSVLLGRRRCSGSKGRGGEIQAFGGSRQVFGGEGGAVLGRMREGRCCPFKRRWPNRDLFSFPGRRAKSRLGAQGGEVRSWALGGGARAGGTPPFRPPCGGPVCLPRSAAQPGSKASVRPGGRGRDKLGTRCPGRVGGDPTQGKRKNRPADLRGEPESADLERT